MLRFADPTQAHPDSTFICGACEQAAIRDWDPIHEYHKRLDREAQKAEGDEESDEGQADPNAEINASKGVADVDKLWEHAATRQTHTEHAGDLCCWSLLDIRPDVSASMQLRRASMQ